MTSVPSGPPDLGLRWCAILRTFDAETLRLLGVPASRVEELVSQGQRVDRETVSEHYVLDETTRQQILDWLRRTDPRDEITLHVRAFQYFVGLLQRVGKSGEQDTAEDACLYHLSALHDLFIEYMEWDSIISYTATLRNILSHRRRVQDWLEFYEAYMDIRMEAVVRGCDRLEQLLTHTDLESALRLRVLHACHIAHIYLSRYDRALGLLHAARPVARALGDNVWRSYLLLAIGQLYNDLDNHQRALKLSKLSLRLARTCRAFYREMHAIYEVGNNAMQLGLWDEAIVALNEAEARYRHLGMSRRLPMVLWAQGMIHLINGDFERCKLVLQEGLAIAQSGHTNDTLATMDILGQLGLLCQARGDVEGALAYFTHAITYADLHAIRHWLPILRARLASILSQRGHRNQAMAAWRMAVQEVEQIRSGIATDAIRIDLFATAQYVYESLVLFLIEQGEIEEAFAYVERARSRALLDLLTRRRDDGTSKQPADIADDQLQRQLKFVEPTTLKQLQRQLAPGEVVLEYFTTGVRPRGDHWLNRVPAHNKALLLAALPAPTTLLFTIAHDTVNVVRLRDTIYDPGLDQGRWTQAPDLDSNKLQPSEQSEDPILDLLRVESLITWLSQRLFAPVEEQIAPYSHIYIIPHGPLHYIPFTALRRRDGHYLLDRGGPSISLAPSASILVHTLRGSPRSRGNDNLAIGYNGPPPSRLEQAEREAAIIARLIHGEAWLGPSAKSGSLMNLHQHLHWLHIAGHAFYAGKRARTVALHLGENDILDADRILRASSWSCQADLVTLSSCMSGLSYVMAGDELFGLQRAFLYAIAPTVVCTVARARDRVALLVMERFYTQLLQGQDIRPAQALRDALVALRSMTRAQINATLKHHGYAPLPEGGPPTDRPFNRPEYWAPFIVIGRA